MPRSLWLLKTLVIFLVFIPFCHCVDILLADDVASASTPITEGNFQDYYLNVGPLPAQHRIFMDIFSFEEAHLFVNYDARATQTVNFLALTSATTGDRTIIIDTWNTSVSQIWIRVLAVSCGSLCTDVDCSMTVSSIDLPQTLTNAVAFIPPFDIPQGDNMYFRLSVDSVPNPSLVSSVLFNMNLFNALNTVYGYVGLDRIPNSTHYDAQMTSNTGDWTLNVDFPQTIVNDTWLLVYGHDCSSCNEITISDLTATYSQIAPTPLVNSSASSSQDLPEGGFSYFIFNVTDQSLGPFPVSVDIYVDLLNPLNYMDLYLAEGSIPTVPFLSGESGDMYATLDLLSSEGYIAVKSVDCVSCNDITFDITGTKTSYSTNLTLGVSLNPSNDIYEGSWRHFSVYNCSGILTVAVDIFNSANTIQVFIGLDKYPTSTVYDARSATDEIGDTTLEVLVPPGTTVAHISIFGKDCPGCNSITVDGVLATIAPVSPINLVNGIESSSYDVTTGGLKVFFYDALTQIPGYNSSEWNVIDLYIDLLNDLNHVATVVGNSTFADSGDQELSIYLPPNTPNFTIVIYGLDCNPSCNDITLDVTATAYSEPIQSLIPNVDTGSYSIFENFSRFFVYSEFAGFETGENLIIDVDRLNGLNDVEICVSPIDFGTNGPFSDFGGWSNCTSGDILNLAGPWILGVNETIPLYIRVRGTSCPGCTEISITSMTIHVEKPIIELIPGIETFAPSLAQGNYQHFFIDLPASQPFHQIDVDIDLLNPANTMYFYWSNVSIANSSNYIYKQDDGESGDLESTWWLEQGRWYLGVYSQDCYGCSKISFDVTATNISWNPLILETPLNVTSLESYGRLLYFDYNNSQDPPVVFNFRVDMNDGQAPVGELEICAFISESQGPIIPPIPSNGPFNVQNCDYYHNEYGDLTGSIPFFSGSNSIGPMRLYFIVSNKFCDVVCDSLSSETNLTLVQMTEITSIPATFESSVFQKEMDYYYFDANKDLYLYARTFYPLVYSLVTDLYLGVNTPPDQNHFTVAATNYSKLALAFPDQPDRAISREIPSGQRTFIGIQGTSCGNLCSNAPYTLQVILVDSDGALAKLNPPSRVAQFVFLGLIVVGAAGCFMTTSFGSYKKFKSQSNYKPHVDNDFEMAHLNDDDIIKSVNETLYCGYISQSSLINLILLLVSIAIFVVGAVLLAQPEDLEVSNCGQRFTKYDIFDLSVEMLSFHVISNPNWASGTLKSLDATVYFKGVEIGKTTLEEKNQKIDSGSYTTIALKTQFDFDFSTAWEIVSQVYNEKFITVTYDLVMEAETESFFGISYNVKLQRSDEKTLEPFAVPDEAPPSECMLVES